MLLRTSCKAETGQGNLHNKASGERDPVSDVNGHRKQPEVTNFVLCGTSQMYFPQGKSS